MREFADPCCFLAQSVDHHFFRSNPDPHYLKTFYGIVSLLRTVDACFFRCQFSFISFVYTKVYQYVKRRYNEILFGKLVKGASGQKTNDRKSDLFSRTIMDKAPPHAHRPMLTKDPSSILSTIRTSRQAESGFRAKILS